MPHLAHAADQFANKCVWAEASADRAKGAVVALTLDSGGFVDKTPDDANAKQVFAVAAHGITSGDKGLYIVQGECFITTPAISGVAGQGLKYNNAAIAATGAALFNGKSFGDATAVDFCVVMESSTTATTQHVCLFGYPFSTTT